MEMSVCSCAESYQRLMRDVASALRVFEASPDVRDELSSRWIEFLMDDLKEVGKSCPIDVYRESAWIEEAGKEVEDRDYIDAADLLEAARDSVAKRIHECAEKE